ncbi:phytoene desaturase family protein [Brumimicrobium aurantiacum]|uniref:Phytoene desaturase n=1 Tax=Brumimicrobium aurantiacum TaxID=1737063 RepID=A0A3E1F1Z1_9FLAO|nr:phytoene desaturase family protein [Brumimicrobium aurantiacum]RFC55727.1 phytoene desaturase [Brumimicrobium aurantiacum]
MNQRKVTVIGSGVAGLSAASYLAKEGHEVTVIEKNPSIGGRARKFNSEGFTFDMGPSWYWMPEVFEKFYNHFGFTTQDFYRLQRLDPSYRVYWKDDSHDDVPANIDDFYAWFEALEPGSSKKLDQFLKEAAYKYDVGMNDLVHKPSLKITEFADMRIVKGTLKLHLFSSFTKYIKTYFSHPKIIELLEFPILFLGAMPKDTPALYSLMNYADIKLGTWYPMGGMHKIIEAFATIAQNEGVKIITDCEAKTFNYQDGKIQSVNTTKGDFETDIVVSGADYHHTDRMLAKGKSNYTEKYWDKRLMAPSSLLFYLGVDKKIDDLLHHNLFFDEDFSDHAEEIYKDPQWPSKPLFYACCPSKTDDSVAPEGMENLFLLIPIAPDLEDSETLREQYFDIILQRLEEKTNTEIKSHIVYKRSYCLTDFKEDYHAFKGNAYGLANTLRQTAFLKPRIINKKIKNLFYTGQLTTPGPGVPPSIISGKVVAEEINKRLLTNKL